MFLCTPDTHIRSKPCPACTATCVLFNEQLHQVQVATRGCGVQRRPELAVAGVDIGTGLQEQLDDVPIVVDAALQYKREVVTGRQFHAAWHCSWVQGLPSICIDCLRDRSPVFA